MKVVKKALASFFKKKRQIDNSDRFNLVLFRGNPSYLEDFTFNSEYLLSLIEEDVENINTIHVENVIFMALTFLIDIYARVGNKFFRIIILTDQDTKDVEREFMVKDLLDITREMPIFIDIVRLNMKPQRDKSKEKLETIINWAKGGELIYVPKIKKQLADVMEKLADKKYNETDDVFEEVREIKIPDKHSLFYENIAVDPKMIEKPGEMKCMACFGTQEDGNKLYECPSCGNAVMHEVCWVYWSKTANIGVRHIFRCPICYALLKMPREFIEDILGVEIEEKIEETIQNVQVADQTEMLMEKDKEAPKLIESLLDSI